MTSGEQSNVATRRYEYDTLARRFTKRLDISMALRGTSQTFGMRACVMRLCMLFRMCC